MRCRFSQILEKHFYVVHSKMLVCNLIYADFLLATLYTAVALNVWKAHLKVLKKLGSDIFIDFSPHFEVILIIFSDNDSHITSLIL